MRWALGIVALLLTTATAVRAGEIAAIQFGSPMKYMANSSNPGIGLAWTEEVFDDSGWQNGIYGVGYENTPPGATNLLQTTVPSGTFSVYTRAKFTIEDIAEVTNLSLGVDYDDGYVAWVNGVEVARSSTMPPGSPSWNTNSGSHESSNGSTPNFNPITDITAAALPVLHGGVNVLAIGIWNSNAVSSSDLVLAPKLSWCCSVAVSRGPYLQLGTPSSVVVRWRTDVPTDGRVRYGSQAGNLTQFADHPASSTEHSVTLTGLSPATKYYYSVGSTTRTLAGGDTSYFFVTSPPQGIAVPTRIWVLGDSGTGDANARSVRDAYYNFTAATHTNLWLMLGDNAYPDGTDAEYQTALFDMYPTMLRKSVLWATLGNHDGHSADSATQSGPYYDSFTLPRAGEAGGLASGTEAYYSFDYGNIHFICLESFETSRSPSGAMLTWARADSEATNQTWVVAFWHHPPYSKGSHNSDAETELIEMRQNALPILENSGVDLVLAGHSHAYERSFFIDGHYGVSSTFNSTMKKDGGDGRIGGQGAYKKSSVSPVAHQGAVYVVAGSSGQTSGGSLDHPAMYLSLSELGSLVLDVNDRQLDIKFLDAAGMWRDYLTLYKGTGTPPSADFNATPRAGTAPLQVQFVDASTGGPSAWKWDFENDGTADSTLQNPSHGYTSPGVYAVGLTSYNAPGSDAEVKAGYVCVTSANGLADADGDGVADGTDNCPCVQDPGQNDNDGDGAGDVCDPDDDNDLVLDPADCAPLLKGVWSQPDPVGATLRLETAGGATLQWGRSRAGHTYNAYRGLIQPGMPWSYGVSCLAAEEPGTTVSDSGIPPLGSAFHYLISARNTCGESALGQDSQGVNIPPTNPCPPQNRDTDTDTVPDLADNCPLVANPAQQDTDHDTSGDACDPD